MKRAKPRSRPATIPRAAVLSLAAAIATLPGCAVSVDFTAPDYSPGVEGKSWQAAYFVDEPLYPSGFQSISDDAAPNNRLAYDFDAVSSGSAIQLVGSWWDRSTTGTYRGYARYYSEDDGWSALSSTGFGQIATDSATSFTSVSVAADTAGLFMANLFTTAGPDSASAYFSDAAWTLKTNNSGLAAAPTAGLVSVMDAQSRGFVFFADGAGVWQSEWTQGSTTGLSSTQNAVYTGATRAGSALTARFDGTHACVTYETAAGLLQGNCKDVSASSGAFAWSAAAAQSISSSVAGHDTATDGEGGIMAIFYRGSGTTYHVYASLASSGTWPSTVTQIDDQDDGFTAPWPTGTAAIAGARPGVAYLGSGRYLAVWVGVDTSTSPPGTQLYSNLYDPALGGWQGASSIDGTEDSFSATHNTPHAQILSVFGNGDGNAGYALNKIHTTDAIGGTHPGGATEMYPETAQVRVLEVNRWQEDEGWLGATSYADNPCFNLYDAASPSLADDASGSGADCTHRPVGVILPSGRTFVFFQAQDGYRSGLVPGNRRVAVAVFE